MDHCEDLIPLYLRFVKGVVDSSDLPLNISREILQSNRQVEIIRKSITGKVLDTLSDMKEHEYDTYLNFYRQFGKIVKEGIHLDFTKKEQIADLLLFPSTKTEKGTFTTLQAYVDKMKEGQEDIYFISGISPDETLSSPYLEAFREKDYEVLFMLDEVDDFIMGGFEYKGKRLKSVTKGDIKLDQTDESDRKKAEEKYEKILGFIKGLLKDDVKDVRMSSRLKDSACCLVGEEGDIDPQMEKVLRAMGQDVPRRKRILEINPSHPVIEAMQSVFEKDSRNPVLSEYAGLLLDQALLLEGSKPKDPAAFAKSIAKLMADNAGRFIT